MARRQTKEEAFRNEVYNAALLTLIEQHVDDPRIERCKKHPLVNVLFIALCAVICGARSFVAMEEFGKARREWLSKILDLRNGIPSHDTFARVLSMLCPDQVFNALKQWTAQLAESTGHNQLAIDGKAIRKARKLAPKDALVYVVSAWSCNLRQVVAIEPVAKSGSEKDAVELLLNFLDVKGMLVSLDAGHCHRDVAEQISDKEGQYLLSVKGNQPSLHEEIKQVTAQFLLEQHPDEAASEADTTTTPPASDVGSAASDSNEQARDAADGAAVQRPPEPSDEQTDAAARSGCDTADMFADKDVGLDKSDACERGHGRQTWWNCVVITNLEHLPHARQWPNVTAVAAVRRYSVDSHGKRSCGTRYYITSMSEPTAKRILEATRRHWQVENCAHWVLDVTFGEDMCSARAFNAAAVVGALRRLALNMLRAAKPARTSVETMRLRATLNPETLTEVIFHRPPTT